jgi:hypothetical protein
MNKLFAFALVLGLAAAAHAGDKKPAAAAPAKAADKITGEVVDITCYASHEAKGDKHASCGQKCLNAGMPAGIVADGKLWVATTADHTAPGTKLASYAGKMVTATGHKIEKDGAMVFEIESVEAAAK